MCGTPVVLLIDEDEVRERSEAANDGSAKEHENGDPAMWRRVMLWGARLQIRLTCGGNQIHYSRIRIERLVAMRLSMLEKLYIEDRMKVNQ